MSTRGRNLRYEKGGIQCVEKKMWELHYPREVWQKEE